MSTGRPVLDHGEGTERVLVGLFHGLLRTTTSGTPMMTSLILPEIARVQWLVVSLLVAISVCRRPRACVLTRVAGRQVFFKLDTASSSESNRLRSCKSVGGASDGGRGVELLAGRGLELLTTCPGHPQPAAHGPAMNRFLSLFVRVLSTGHDDDGTGVSAG